MNVEPEKTSFLRKTSSIRKLSENRIIQVICACIVVYLVMANLKPRSDFDACFELGQEVWLENNKSSKLSKADLEKTARQIAITFCMPKR
tara:strand:- start:289 stop:558 length:270 start_codon:yes stop_codon:yes gene_type:complete